MYVYMIYVLYNTSRRVGNRSSGWARFEKKTLGGVAPYEFLDQLYPKINVEQNQIILKEWPGIYKVLWPWGYDRFLL